jgi:hypothetical protein
MLRSEIESGTISVKKEKYIEILPRLKEMLDAILTELDEPKDSDELIHFSIQIFPEDFFRKKRLRG